MGVSKTIKESKKFLFGLVAMIMSLVALFVTIIFICLYQSVAANITQLTTTFFPFFFGTISILIGGQAAIDHKHNGTEQQK